MSFSSFSTTANQSMCRVPMANTSLVSLSVADPDPLGSGNRCLFDPSIRDPGWVKSQDPEPFFRVKILKFFYADPGSGMENNSDPGWEKVGSGPG